MSEEEKSPTIHVPAHGAGSESGIQPARENINELMATIIKNVSIGQNPEQNPKTTSGQESPEDPEYARIIEETLKTPPKPPCCSRVNPFMRKLIEESDGGIGSNSEVEKPEWKAILLLLDSHKNLTESLRELL